MSHYRVEIPSDQSVSGAFENLDEADRAARAYAVQDRKAATVSDPDGQLVSRWQPPSLEGLSVLQVAIYEQIRAHGGKTPPLNYGDLADSHDVQEEDVAVACKVLGERHLLIRPAASATESWVRLDLGSHDAAWRADQ